MLNPLAWTSARTPCILYAGRLYAGRRIPRQFQLKDGWTCAGDTQVLPTDNGVGRLLVADEDE
jgi:hypothetical protein